MDLNHTTLRNTDPEPRANKKRIHLDAYLERNTNEGHGWMVDVDQVLVQRVHLQKKVDIKREKKEKRRKGKRHNKQEKQTSEIVKKR